jgi:hypothetical protein
MSLDEIKWFLSKIIYLFKWEGGSAGLITTFQILIHDCPTIEKQFQELVYQGIRKNFLF